MADLVIFANANAAMADYPLLIQATGGDAAISYTGPDFRQLIDVIAQSGVCTMGAFRVTQRGAGANLSVDVAAGQAVIQGTSVTRQGKFLVDSTATVNTGTAGNITVPGSGTRTHRVIIRARDKQASGTAYGWSIEVLEDTGSGLPALPASSIDLASIAVPAGSASVTDSMITDRRGYACPSIPLSIQTLAATTATISFAGIPGFIRALEIDWTARCDAVGNSFVLGARINGDTAGNYARLYKTVLGNGTASPAQGAPVLNADTYIRLGIIPGTTTTTGFFGEGDVKIPKWRTDNTSTRPKMLFRSSLYDTASNMAEENGWGVWVGTGAPSSITLISTAGSFIAGSQFILRAVA